MENITHSLMGATLAQLAVPPDATPAQRRIFVTVGIVAANLPDADLLYTSISPAPLGYLLHHRGHTHTIAGLVAQAVLVGAVCLLPPVRRHVGPATRRLWSLIALALLSHLVLDSWNSYGVHPFWPLTGRWIYGDAIFIADPWLWTIMGVAATLGMRSRRGQLTLGIVLALLTAALVRIGMIAPASLVALAVGAAALGLALRRSAPRRRAGVALALVSLYVAAMFGLHARVESRVRNALASVTADPALDVILSPHGANPLCWNVVAITASTGRDEYALRGATSTAAGTAGCGAPRSNAVTWDPPARRSIGELQRLAAENCAVRAWLQFGRAPDVSHGTIADYRFGGAGRGNFSSMPLAGDACPPNLPEWGTPRGDLVGPPR